jgi:hypothetical protein
MFVMPIKVLLADDAEFGCVVQFVIFSKKTRRFV